MAQQTSKKGITKKQRKFLNDLKEYLNEVDYDPSYDEIAFTLDMSKANVARYLSALQSKGYIKKEPNLRGFEIVENDAE